MFLLYFLYRVNLFLTYCVLIFVSLIICFGKTQYVVGTDPDRNRVTWETPTEKHSLRQKPKGVLASYATRAQTQV